MKPSADELADRLRSRFAHARLSVMDDSHLHAGHAGASGGAGHYSVVIRWPGFAGLSKLAQHRLVYDAVKDWMPDRIHALSIQSSE